MRKVEMPEYRKSVSLPGVFLITSRLTLQVRGPKDFWSHLYLIVDRFALLFMAKDRDRRHGEET